jgi:hypothetical protein
MPAARTGQALKTGPTRAFRLPYAVALVLACRLVSAATGVASPIAQRNISPGDMFAAALTVRLAV